MISSNILASGDPHPRKSSKKKCFTITKTLGSSKKVCNTVSATGALVSAVATPSKSAAGRVNFLTENKAQPNPQLILAPPVLKLQAPLRIDQAPSLENQLQRLKQLREDASTKLSSKPRLEAPLPFPSSEGLFSLPSTSYTPQASRDQSRLLFSSSRGGGPMNQQGSGGSTLHALSHLALQPPSVIDPEADAYNGILTTRNEPTSRPSRQAGSGLSGIKYMEKLEQVRLLQRQGTALLARTNSLRSRS